MLEKGKLYYGISFVALFLMLIIAASSMMTGCTPAQQTVQISPERQKAIQDSLDKAYRHQLDLNFSIGREHQKNGNHKDSIKPYWKVVELDTIDRFPDIYTFLGDCYMKLDKPDSALIVFKMGTERAPQKIHNHRMTAYLSIPLGDNETAINEYRKTIELDPDNLSDYKALGTLLLQENMLEDALEIYNKILELSPQDAEAADTKTRIMSSLGFDDYDIIDAKKEALATNETDTQLMSEIADKYFKLAEYKNALEYYNMYLAIKSDDERVLEYAGSCYQNMTQYKDAIAVYEKVLAVNPEHKKVLCEMGVCYKELKQFVKARSMANKAIAVDSNYGLAYMVRGLTYEACADECIGKREKRVSKIDDKLVYKLAYDEYQKAAKDVMFSDQARNRMNYIKPEIPSQEDLFMYPNKKKAELDCYKWIY